MQAFIRGAWRAFTDPGIAPTRLAPPLDSGVSHLQSIALLGARLYVAQIFFQSGLTKLRDWSSTLALFQDIYQVPLLPPVAAAWAGTAGELVLPVLLALGLAGRFAAAGLFVVNGVAVMSLMAEDLTPAAQAQHALWGVLALGVALWGAGRWSVDRWLATRAA